MRISVALMVALLFFGCSRKVSSDELTSILVENNFEFKCDCFGLDEPVSMRFLADGTLQSKGGGSKWKLRQGGETVYLWLGHGDITWFKVERVTYDEIILEGNSALTMEGPFEARLKFVR